MFRYLLISACFVAASVVSPAQGLLSFQQGYVVTPAGDTLRGEVQHRIDLEQTLAAHFRDHSGATTVYRPADLLGYGFDDGRRFVTRELVPGPDVEAQPLFLQVLAEGAVSLYAFSFTQPTSTPDDRAPAQVAADRYAIEYGGRTTPLYTARRRHETELSKMTVDRQYVRVLAAAFADCPAVQARAPRTPYSRQGLLRAVARYHDCLGTPIQVASAAGLLGQRAIAADLSVRVGGGTRTITHQRGKMPSEPPSSIPNGSGHTVAAEGLLDVKLNAISPSLAIPIGLALSKTAVEGDWLSDIHPSYNFYRAEDFDRYRVAFSLGGRYTLPTRGVAPSFSAGTTIAHLLGEKTVSSSWTLPGGSGPRTFPSWESGWYVELGGTSSGPGPLRALELTVRYETAAIGHPSPLMRSRSSWLVSSVSGAVGVRF